MAPRCSGCDAGPMSNDGNPCPSGHTNPPSSLFCGVCGLALSPNPDEPAQAAGVATSSEHAVRWQYAVVSLGAFGAVGRLTKTLGHLGSEGWELVHVYDKASNWFNGMEKGFALFKRLIPPGQEPDDGTWAVHYDANGTITAKAQGDAPKPPPMTPWQALKSPMR